MKKSPKEEEDESFTVEKEIIAYLRHDKCASINLFYFCESNSISELK